MEPGRGDRRHGRPDGGWRCGHKGSSTAVLRALLLEPAEASALNLPGTGAHHHRVPGSLVCKQLWLRVGGDEWR